jgi:hypothetical protein
MSKRGNYRINTSKMAYTVGPRTYIELCQKFSSHQRKTVFAADMDGIGRRNDTWYDGIQHNDTQHYEIDSDTCGKNDISQQQGFVSL